MAGFNCFFILTLFIALLVSGGQVARHLQQFPPLPSILNLLFGNTDNFAPLPSIPARPQPTLPTLPTTQPSLPKRALPPLPGHMPSIPTIPTIIPIPFLSPPPGN
ncbi:hypothetical protein Peur_066426 [Populus x canadensis]